MSQAWLDEANLIHAELIGATLRGTILGEANLSEVNPARANLTVAVLIKSRLIGAVRGQLAGAFYGEEYIPAAWRDTIARRELIAGLAERRFKQGAA